MNSLTNTLRAGSHLTTRYGFIHTAHSASLRSLHTTSRRCAAVTASAPSISGNPSYPEWTPQSRRTGVVGFKKGMLTVWSEEGKILPITILQLEDNQVCQTKTIEKEGNAALQIGAREVKKIHKVSMPQIGHYKHAGNGVTLKKKLLDFRITPDATLPVGTPITAAHFVPGQFVDVCATSKGKGFQGGIKRHGMNRQPATHGNSKSHRKMGGTGGCQDPGRVFPGKRMPGHMGNTRVTKLNLRVYRVEPRHNAIYVIGAVPGHKETYVRITDSRRKEFLQPPPFPTHIPSIHGQAAPETTADLNVPIMKQA